MIDVGSKVSSTAGVVVRGRLVPLSSLVSCDFSVFLCARRRKKQNARKRVVEKIKNN